MVESIAQGNSNKTKEKPERLPDLGLTLKEPWWQKAIDSLPEFRRNFYKVKSKIQIIYFFFC